MLSILKYPDPRLSEKCGVVAHGEWAHMQNIFREMIRLMLAEGGLGLSGSQIGVLSRVFVINKKALNRSGPVPGNCPKVWINPVVLEASDEMKVAEEGCLSRPGVRVNVKRPAWVRVKCRDENGTELEVMCKGLLARCVQHEMDHFEGVSIFDKAEKPVEPMEQHRRSMAAALPLLSVSAAWVDPFPPPDGETCPECGKPWKPEGRYRVCAPCREKVNPLNFAMPFVAMLAARSHNTTVGPEREYP